MHGMQQMLPKDTVLVDKHGHQLVCGVFASDAATVLTCVMGNSTLQCHVQGLDMLIGHVWNVVMVVVKEVVK